MKIKLPAVALILANLLPLAGVVWLDWRVFDVLMLYWAENVVIGVVNVMRMAVCVSSEKSRYTVIPFFVLHYGMFCFGHYSAVVSLFGHELGNAADGNPFLSMSFREAWHSPLWMGVAAITASHLLSFFLNFIGRGEYQRTNLKQLMRRPYGRIIVLHVSVIAGGFLVTTLGDPLWMLLVLIVIKSAFDLRMHEKERLIFAADNATS